MNETTDESPSAVAGQVERRVRPLVERLRLVHEDCGLTFAGEAADEIERLCEELRRASERAEFLLAATRDAQDHALAYGFKVSAYAEALRRVKCEAISLADAQVLALEALGPNAELSGPPKAGRA